MTIDSYEKRIEVLEKALMKIPEYLNIIGWNDTHGTCNAKNHTDVLCRAAKEIAEKAIEESNKLIPDY